MNAEGRRNFIAVDNSVREMKFDHSFVDGYVDADRDTETICVFCVHLRPEEQCCGLLRFLGFRDHPRALNTGDV